MTNLSNRLAKGFIEMVVTTGAPDRWGSTPGVIPAKTVAKRRARNKAARRSRAKNR
jgi:hypothetical protein